MQINNRTISVVKYFTLILFSAALFIGCDSTKESAEDALEKTNDAISETADKVEDAGAETIENVTEAVDNVLEQNQFVGKWNGKFDIRTADMIITKQTGNEFEGKVTINLRSPVKQDVKGTFDQVTKKVIIKDQLRNKFKGVYSGTLSEDETTISGTFTTNLDNKNYSFSFNKKQ